MDYLAAMQAFVRSVDLGSFSKAAAEGGLKVSTVSRYVSALEADLGAALLNRSTRNLHLTEVGRLFYERAAQILAAVADARGAATSLNARPQGLLRINIPSAFGRRHVLAHMKDFLAAYPDIRLDAILTDATVDLIESGADVAVRIGALVNSALVARKLAPHRRILVAKPGLSGPPIAAADPGSAARSSMPVVRVAADRQLVSPTRGSAAGGARGSGLRAIAGERFRGAARRRDRGPGDRAAANLAGGRRCPRSAPSLGAA
jgi:DNA-binding transcriptional LysR family regulator